MPAARRPPASRPLPGSPMADEISREKEKVIGVFDRAASIYDRVGPRVFSHFGRRLVEMAALAPGMRVLDVAAGRGAQLFPAAKAVGASGRVIGIDLSADMVRETSAEIQNLGLGNAEIRRMDGEALDFPDAEFDRVLCGMALWMFSRPEVALREFLRVLKPGGRLGVCTWARDCPYQNIRDELMRPYLPPGTSSRAKQTGVMFKMPEELLEALALAGFEDARVSVEEHELVFESED